MWMNARPVMAAFDPLGTLGLGRNLLTRPLEGEQMRELVIPPAAQGDGDSWELLRAWVADHGLHCSVKVGAYEAEGIPEAQAWGTILADAARHVADAMSSLGIGDSSTALA